MKYHVFKHKDQLAFIELYHSKVDESGSQNSAGAVRPHAQPSYQAINAFRYVSRVQIDGSRKRVGLRVYTRNGDGRQCGGVVVWPKLFHQNITIPFHSSSKKFKKDPTCCKFEFHLPFLVYLNIGWIRASNYRVRINSGRQFKVLNISRNRTGQKTNCIFDCKWHGVKFYPYLLFRVQVVCQQVGGFCFSLNSLQKCALFTYILAYFLFLITYIFTKIIFNKILLFTLCFF